MTVTVSTEPYIIVEGGVVQNNPDLPVLDLDELTTTTENLTGIEHLRDMAVLLGLTDIVTRVDARLSELDHTYCAYCQTAWPAGTGCDCDPDTHHTTTTQEPILDRYRWACTCGHVEFAHTEGEAVEDAERHTLVNDAGPVEDHQFTLRISGCTRDQAEQVLNERTGFDEDYGFTYTLTWAQVSAGAAATEHEAQVLIGGCTRTQAEHVLAERFYYDEDYGFPYSLT